jgi:phosphate-selective porin OprO/OprP
MRSVFAVQTTGGRTKYQLNDQTIGEKLKEKTMNAKQALVLLILAGGLVKDQRAWADDTNTTNELTALKQQIEALDQKVRLLEHKQEQGADDAAAKAKDQQIQDLGQKVRVLERKGEVDREAAAESAKEAAKTTPALMAGASGFSFRSADTNFVIALHGHLQLDSRTFFKDGGIRGNDAFLLRRARPILQGTVFRDFDFMFVPDFGGSTVQILDAYMNYRFRPELQLEAGKFKSPVGLEHLQGDASLTFNERSLVTDLVPNRDLGVELHGDVFGGIVSYAAAIFDGAPDYSGTTANTDYEDNKAFAGRLFFQPFKQTSISPLKGFGFGVGGSYEVDRAATNTTGTGLTPGFTTDGQQVFFKYSPTNGSVFADGTHWRISPQGYYYFGPVSLLGEYVISHERVTNSKLGSAHLENTAWEVSAGWVLTGEDASYSGVTPAHSFDPMSGCWGAFQVVGRYAELKVDGATFPTFADSALSASGAQAWAAGLNWYLNRDVRVNLSYSRTTFDGGTGAKATVTKQPEDVFFTRIQVAF